MGGFLLVKGVKNMTRKREILGKTEGTSHGRVEIAPKRAIAPIHIVNDFNDHRSHVECEQEIRAIFGQNGVLYEAPHVISDVEPFNITDGAFKFYQLVSNLRRHNSPGIFIGVVDPGVGSERKGIAVTTKEGYTFVGPDNGLFSPALKDLTIAHAYQIKPEAFKQSSVTFHGRDQFTPIAAEIACGKHPEDLPQLQEIDATTLINKDFVEGQVIETDGYPNVKIWQDQKGLPKNEHGERARYLVVSSPKLIRRRGLVWSHSVQIPVADCFEDVSVGEWLVYEGSSGRRPEDNTGVLEIAIRDRSGKQGAGNRLKAQTGDVLKLSWIF